MRVEQDDPRSAVGAMVDRRAHARCEAIGCVVGGTLARFIVREISAGGLSLSSRLKLGNEWLHEIRLTAGSVTIVRQLRIVHTHKDADGSWVTGAAFVERSGGGPSVQDLIDALPEPIPHP